MQGILGIGTKWNDRGQFTISTVVAVELKKLADAESLRMSCESCMNENGHQCAKWSTMAEIIEFEKLKLFDHNDLLFAKKFVQGKYCQSSILFPKI